MYCFICQRKPKKLDIVRLTQEKFDKCFEILASRKIYKLAYSDVSLPAELTEELGYHQSCYSKFTALKAKYKVTSENQESEET